jgi:hypothetical protein
MGSAFQVASADDMTELDLTLLMNGFNLQFAVPGVLISP